MTKEEAIDYLDNYRKLYAERFLEALDTLLSESQLPSNMDEAAEKNFETMEVLEHENIFEETHNKIFKAGAEWMAGQGVSIVAVANQEDGISEEGMKLMENYLESLPSKTEVVLQIRKA
jgi:hypothetical protein